MTISRRQAALLSCALAFAAPAPAAPGHHHADPAAEEAAPSGLPPAPGGLQRSLQDHTRRSGPGRMAWSTTWSLCWQPVAGAAHYEVRLLTAEGASRTPRRVADTCYRVEAAAGENPRADGMPRRALMLAMQSAQSSVGVRAVFADGRVTDWTAGQPVGAVQ